MSSFTLHLQDATKYDRINDVNAFVGRDKTGKFGLMAYHDRFITTLAFGLAKYKIDNVNWVYIALPSGVLHFVNNELFISTRQYLIDENYERISEELEIRIRNEENKTKNMRQSLHEMEQAMFKRLWDVGRIS